MARRVVVTGIGAVSPNGVGRENFWRATREGVSGIRRITRFDPSGHAVQVAGEVADFDEHRYVSPKDRPHVSRAVPLALAAVEETLCDAGLESDAMTRDQLRGIGVIVGSGGGSQEFTEEQYRLYYTGHQKQCSVYTIPTGTIGTLASEVSMRFGFRGMSHIVSTGCTSSTDAIGYAYRNIQAGVIDTVVTGGVDAPIAPLILRGFMLMRILTTSWNDRAAARLAPVLPRSRRLRAGGRRLVFCFGRTRAGDGARSAHLRRNRRLRLHLRGFPPRTAGRMRRGAGANHYSWRLKKPACRPKPCNTSTITEPPRSSTTASKPAPSSWPLTGRRTRWPARRSRASSAIHRALAVPRELPLRCWPCATALRPPPKTSKSPTRNVTSITFPQGARKLDIEYAVANCIAFGSKNSAIILRRN